MNLYDFIHLQFTLYFNTVAHCKPRYGGKECICILKLEIKIKQTEMMQCLQVPSVTTTEIVNKEIIPGYLHYLSRLLSEYMQLHEDCQ